MSYPYFDIQKRTDSDFRARRCPEHHKEKSPLENLDIDMIQDFPVADILHLIDMKNYEDDSLIMDFRFENF